MAERLDRLPIKHWSYSSLMAYLRNPLAWYKRYVEQVYDIPATPGSIVGRACHKALEHFYSGLGKEAAVELGLEYLRGVSDFEINFGKARSRLARKKKRAAMEREYLQAIGFFLKRPPRYDVLGVEVRGTADVPGLLLPVRAVSDLVARSKTDKNALDIVDYKFVDSFSALGNQKALFIIQAIFNYYAVGQTMGLPVRRFILHECKKRKNADGSSQLKRYVITFDEQSEEFAIFRKLVNDATLDLARRRVFLPNPSDLFEGEESFDIYRLGLVEE
ncbi:MAG: PD-(D/E)XK nuclease family protein [Minisyncoccia bacterium]